MKHTKIYVIAALLGLLQACASYNGPGEIYSDRLETFSSEEEFEQYFKTLNGEFDKEEDAEYDGSYPPPPLPPPPPPPPPPAPVASAPASEAVQETVVVTAAKVSSDDNPSITNTQEAGVDEGDIIKQIGTHLIVLQDGRLFSVDLLPGGEPGLSLRDRENVYQSPDEGTWYDEALVFGRSIIAIGYSYERQASEFAILELGDGGELNFRDRFFLPSQDYFDGDNYTTRLVNGQLAMHTSYYLLDAEDFSKLSAPILVREEQLDEERKLNPRSVYKSLQNTEDPLLHTITMCPLKDIGNVDAPTPQCKTTAFIAGASYEYYASTDAVWLWLNNKERWSRQEDLGKALLYRIPYGDENPSVATVEGRPQNQFSLAADTDVFRALVRKDQEERDDVLQLMELPLSAFGLKPAGVETATYHDLPDTDGRLENRFTGTHLVYTLENEERWWNPFWSDDQNSADAKLAVVPFEAPGEVQTITIPHSVIRLERARDHIVATGYADEKGLSLSSLDLRSGAARLADTATLPARYESENRSHAFNSRIEDDGSGMIGIPTVVRISESGRPVWRSKQSDISFLQVGADAALRSAGTLYPSGNPEHPDYECEVSCIDWYGNSRPVFTMGRIFALSGTELVEGEMRNGFVNKTRSVDLTAPVQ